MSKARLVITSVTVEKRPVSEVARTYGVARSWICTLLARYEAEGEAAFGPRSRRPETSPDAISPETAGLIVRLRKDLAGQGLDAGPDTIAWHLQHQHQITVPAATIARYLAARSLVVPEPRKRPRSSCIRFAAGQPNECRQSGFTRYPLAGGTGTEILTWLDDHSRYALSVTAWNRVTGPIVLTAFRAAVTRHSAPASTLTDNGMVFTTRLSGGKGAFEHELRGPGDRAAGTHDRVRTGKAGTTGTVTLRHRGKLHHIGIGREHAGTGILLLVQDLHIRIIGAATGELLRELTLDPTRNYQPTGRPPGPRPRTPRPAQVRGVLDVLRDLNSGPNVPPCEPADTGRR